MQQKTSPYQRYPAYTISYKAGQHAAASGQAFTGTQPTLHYIGQVSMQQQVGLSQVPSLHHTICIGQVRM